MKNPRRVIIFASIILVVAGVSIGAALFLSNKKAEEATTTTPTSTIPSRLPSEEKSDDADKLVYSGGVKSAIAAYDEAIANTDDSNEQFVYYMRKAELLFDNKDNDGALAAASKAFEIDDTSTGAAFVAQIARAKGDNAMAIEYYKKALGLLDSAVNPVAHRDKEYYEATIKELEAGQ